MNYDLDYFINFDEILENIDYKLGDIRELFTDKLIDNKIINTKLLNEPLNILWGVQPRNIPSLEFLIPILQIIKFIKNGFRITILLADVHELLDSPHLTMDIITHRNKAYVLLISLLVELFDINSNYITCVYGSTFQTSSNYTMDIYKISSMTTIQETYNAKELNNDLSESSKNIKTCDKKMTTMLYPILQALDEKYTNCDIFYGSITQKNMCEYSSNLMKKFNNNKNIVYLLQDLTKKINISFFDPLDTIENKLNDFTEDELIYLNKNILFPLLKYKNDIPKINDINDVNDVNINNYDEFLLYCKNNDISIDEIKKFTAKYLSKHLNKFYDTLISSSFNEHYMNAWLRYN
jgi:tyrosyl-tRNA synthetase